jgi:NADPH2:quinone reductase
VRELTGGKGVPVVDDSVGKSTFQGSLDCLRPLGPMVSFGNASGAVPACPPGSCRCLRPLRRFVWEFGTAPA